jgi:subtilisin family serine protease
VSTKLARRLARSTAKRGMVDLDHFYYPDGYISSQPACKDGNCATASLVGFTDLTSRHCGKSPTIGMIDTAINLQDEALRGAQIEVVTQRNAALAPSGKEHGTAIAAMLVGTSRHQSVGLVPDAHMVAVDAFFRDGNLEDKTDAAALVAAIELLVERGVKVINLSLSGPENAVLENTINAARARGVTFVAAAGNGGPGADPSYPAGYPGVIAVTAVNADLTIYHRATRGKYISLSAPGVLVAPGSSEKRSGTSYAVPFVTAAAALLTGQNASLSPDIIAARLQASARDLGEPGYDTTFGWGLLQVQVLCSPYPLSPNTPTRATTDTAEAPPT